MNEMQQSPAEREVAMREVLESALQVGLEGHIQAIRRLVGLYGRRTRNPVRIEWGNGITLQDKNGYLVASGHEHVSAMVARWLMEEFVLSEAPREGGSDE